MLASLARRMFGSANDRLIKSLQKTVDEINALEPRLSQLGDAELRHQTVLFRERLAKGEALDGLLPEAFATVREAAKRTLGQRHYDVQLKGGIVLHRGMIAEMKTGEGKTLVATLPVYLNALLGKGVHVVTVNDYLARRDAEWMGQIYRFLGLAVGTIIPGLSHQDRRTAYAADITYGTNNEFAFDYLRDNMKHRLTDMVQRPFYFAIVDEVDSILIDEARTPLIISGEAEDSSELYMRVNRLMARLVDADFEKDEKTRQVTLTDPGVEHIEAMLQEEGLMQSGSLYDIHNISVLHHVNAALRAHKLFTREVDYIVENNKVVIIDEFTGRKMEGRRYSEGLHQALEAKEQVQIQNENQTLASISFQNYFRLYGKLAGMTGTAMTEAEEFGNIYSLEVVEIPPNVPVQRVDYDDEIYLTAKEKYASIITLIEECRARKQPVLVGTVSIEKSELLAELLKKDNIPHQVLNARYHEREALIIAQAGVPGAVTIATNMAGRGTDIQLGGNAEMRIRTELDPDLTPAQRESAARRIREEVESLKQVALAAGGLFVLGTERHESRRIDNQLRGRSGRQGDPGASRFFLSLEDDLMRIFGGERMDGILRRLGLKEGEAITHPWVNKAVEKAQQKVEARNFDIRKNLLRFDNVMNDQRKVIYDQRRELMGADDVADTVREMRQETVNDLVAAAIPANSYREQWNLQGLHEEAKRVLGLDIPVDEWAREEGMGQADILKRVTEAADRKMAEKASRYGIEVMRAIEKSVVLLLLDNAWKEHLMMLDHLRQGISFRAYAQRDPLNEYKREAFDLFQSMLDRLRETVTTHLMHVELRLAEQPPQQIEETILEAQPQPKIIERRGGDGISEPGEEDEAGLRTIRKTDIDLSDPETWKILPRNAPCPCGSGKKYKQCHGQI